MFKLWKLIWKPIEKGLKFIGKVQSTILLTITYVVLLAPIAIVLRITNIGKKTSRQKTYWKERQAVSEDPRELLRQF